MFGFYSKKISFSRWGVVIRNFGKSFLSNFDVYLDLGVIDLRYIFFFGKFNLYFYRWFYNQKLSNLFVNIFIKLQYNDMFFIFSEITKIVLGFVRKLLMSILLIVLFSINL